MDDTDDAQFDALIERSSLGTPAARELRGRTSRAQVDAARRIVELRTRMAHPKDSDDAADAARSLIRLLRDLGYKAQANDVMYEAFTGRETNMAHHMAQVFDHMAQGCERLERVVRGGQTRTNQEGGQQTHAGGVALATRPHPPADWEASPGAGSDDTAGEVVTPDLTIIPGLRPAGSATDVANLVGRARNGDAVAFRFFFDQYSDTIFRYVFYRVGSTQLAEDIVSETFLRALRRIESLTWQGTDIRAWFVTIARNLVIDHVRLSRTQLKFPTDDILSAAEARASSTAGGPENTVLAARNRALLDAVRKLSPDQQECVVLRFLEGLTLRETAMVMGRKENAIKALQLRAVRMLARNLPPIPDLI